MNEPSSILGQTGSEDVTIEAGVASDSQWVAARATQMRLVEADEAELTGDMRTLLRSRLRASALVLLMGFSVFIIYRAAADLFEWAHPDTPFLDAILIGQVLVAMVLGGCMVSLCRRCGAQASSRKLRAEELLIFGAPATFFCVWQFISMRDCAAAGQLLPRADSPWLMLMFTYAMFIPNTWRRAAVVLGSMVIVPIGLVVCLGLGDQICSAVIAEKSWEIALAGLTVAVGGAAAVIGVHTINSLRAEAFEARQLGQYRLGERIGSGGMGEVYLAEHQLMKRRCAIKVVRPEKAGDPRTLARFEREVRATARLSHWNNIDIFDYGRAADGTFYYVMEYLPGMSLAELVERHGPLPAERVVFLLRQTCDALSEAHVMGLIHRDIKPANIIAAQRGGLHDVAKLLDFGMVKPIQTERSSQITHDGLIAGSPLYMSPEQAVGDSWVDARSDIYSLGAVAYYLLSGRPPFQGNLPIKILIAHAHQDPAPLVELVPDVPPDLAGVVMRCLAKAPEDRYPSAAALAAALDACNLPRRWSYGVAAAWWAARRD
ncbi:MAG: serine/threonine protein kinase [Planctomycetes bacterium]|nr:serine/threonine protein kinase [Planctomycetota bacterium]